MEVLNILSKFEEDARWFDMKMSRKMQSGFDQTFLKFVEIDVEGKRVMVE